MEYKIIHSVLDLPTFDKELPVFCDIETDDLYGPLRMIQMYQPQTDPNVYIVDIAPIGYDKPTWHRELLNVEDALMRLHTVWYNSSYDLGTLNISPSMGIKHPEEVTSSTTYTHRVDDLFYAVKTAYAEFMQFGLKKIVKKLSYTKGLYNGIDTEESAKGFVRGAYISNQAYRYAALDVYALSLIWEDKKVQLVVTDNVAYSIDMRSQAYALIYQQNGLLLDRNMWTKKLEHAKKKVAEYTAKLPAGFNPNSFKEVRAHLNIDKSDHEALVVFAASDSSKAEDALAIIELKKYKKQVTYLLSIEFDRMFTKFNAAGAITGRFTSAGGSLPDHFNAQQIPRDFQSLFTSSTADTRVIGLDYSTLELRLACGIFGSSYMHKQLLNGEDLHSSMARLVSGKAMPPTDAGLDLESHNLLNSWEDDTEYLSVKDRHNAKGVNFGYVFGMSAKAFIPYAFTGYGITVTLDESVRLRAKYFKLYPEFAEYHNRVWSNYKKPGFFVYTALGRKVKPKLGTDGINTPVQGSGSETTKLASHYMIKENPLSLKYIYNIVHDAIYTRVPAESYDYWKELQSRNMIKGWTEISKCPIMKYNDIPMEVD